MNVETDVGEFNEADEFEGFGQEDLREQEDAVLDALVWIEEGAIQTLIGRRWISAGGDKTVTWCVSDAVVASHVLLLENVRETAAAQPAPLNKYL